MVKTKKSSGGGNSRPLETERIFLLYEGNKLRMVSAFPDRIKDAVKTMLVNEEASYEGGIGDFAYDWSNISLREINEKLSKARILSYAEERPKGGYRKFVYMIYDVDETAPFRPRELVYVTNDESHLKDFVAHKITAGDYQYGEKWAAREQIAEYLYDWDNIPRKYLNHKMRYGMTSAIEDGKVLT